MSRPESPNIDPTQQKPSAPTETPATASKNVDIQQELNRLEEMILASPRVPLSRRTLVDEERLLDQLDLVRLHLPTVFQEAQAIVQQKQEILLQAEQYAQEVVEAAEARAAQILSEMDIVRQAELQARQIQQQVLQECEAAQEQNITEINQMHQQAQQELAEIRQRALAEAEEIQRGADQYADHVLQNIEQQLQDILRIIHNGRQQLHPETSPPATTN